MKPDNAYFRDKRSVVGWCKKGMLWECCLENLLRWMALFGLRAVGVFSGHIHMLLRSTRGAIFAVIQSTMALRSVARATSLPNNNSGIDFG